MNKTTYTIEKGSGIAISIDKTNTNLFSDIKSLFKSFVLIANVLPVLTGFWLAIQFSNVSFIEHMGLFLLTIIGSTLVIAGALVLNNWYDVDIDTVMERTKNRPTVTGNFSLKTVLWIGITLTVLGFIVLLFTTIEATIYALIGWFTYVILYTMWSKRRYAINTVIGSVSGAVTPLIGWAALSPANHILPITLFLILFIWQMPHTYAIAIRKYDDYKAARVAMLPVVSGIKTTKWHMLVYVILLMPLPFFVGELGSVFIGIATLLNIAWLIILIKGFSAKNDHKWATVNFLFSVNYLMIIFILAMIVTF